MSKKRTGDAKRELKEFVEAADLCGAVEERPWPEQKARAAERATKAHFDIEQILFRGTLEADIEYLAGIAVDELNKSPDLQELSPEYTFLKFLAVRLADSLSLCYRDPDEIAVLPDAVTLALSFLYLFPNLWEALDKPLTLDEINALDFKRLLSERRKVEIGKPKSK